MSDTPVSKAMQLCLDQIHAGRTRAWIAEQIGCGSSHIRRYMLGHYAGKADAIEKKIIARFERRICPHDGQEKQLIHCQRIALRPRPHGFPDAETLWLSCQSCPHKPMDTAQTGHKGVSK